MNGRTNSTTSNDINIDITKSPFATLPPSDLVAHRGNQKVDIGWVEPVTKIAVPGDDIVAKREYTILIRNDEHAPVDRHDGIEIYRNTDQTESASGAYSDTGLTNGHEYFYGLIAITDNNVPSEVATISRIPSKEVVYSGSLDSLSLIESTGHWTDTLGHPTIATAGNQQAIIMAVNNVCEHYYVGSYLMDDRYLYVNNINAYNISLTKQDIQIDYRFDETTYSTNLHYLSPVSLGNYALFGFCGSDYRIALTGIAVIDSNLTVVTPVPRFHQDEKYRKGTAFNGYACWFSSYQHDNDYIQNYSDFDYLSESLTMSYIDMDSIQGKCTAGLRPIGDYLCIGPGFYTENNAAYNTIEPDSTMQYISKDWTVNYITAPYPGGGTYNRSFNEPAETEFANLLESTGTYIFYANGSTTIEIVDTNMTVGPSLTNPFATNTSSHWSHDEYVIIFAQGAPGDCVAYDKYLTATYPPDVTQTHTNAFATSLQNHAIFGGSSNNNVDVYST